MSDHTQLPPVAGPTKHSDQPTIPSRRGWFKYLALTGAVGAATMLTGCGIRHPNQGFGTFDRRQASAVPRHYRR